MTPSCLSSHPHGTLHTTCLLSQNWATHPVPPPLQHPSLPIHHLPSSGVPWMKNSTPSPVPIKHNLWKCHAMKRDRMAALPSEFFGPSLSRARSVTHHHHHHHHHAARHKQPRRALHSRGDVNCFRHLRRNPLHKSTLRFHFTLLFVFFFFSSLSY
jgi:hypothetical protein